MVEGRYLGHHGRTGSLLVMTEQGVLRGTGARREPEDKRWSLEKWTSLKGFPWDVAPRAAAQRLEKPLVSGADAESLPSAQGPVRVLPGQERRMYVTKADIEKFGPTDECQACTMIQMGGTATIAHTNACRLRIAECLRESDEGRERLKQHRRKRKQREEQPEDAKKRREPEEVPAASSDDPAGSRHAPAAMDLPAGSAAGGPSQGVKRGATVAVENLDADQVREI